MSDRIAAITLRRLPVAELRPHPRNPRVHPAPDSPLWIVIRKSIEHDYFDPLVWNSRNGYLVSGHLRLKILTELHFTHVEELLSKAEQLQQKWAVQPGDLYHIGSHKLLCGDCSSLT